MDVYFDNFGNWSDVSAEFSGDYDRPSTPKIPEPDEVIFAGYTYEDYSGDAVVVYRNGDKFYIVEGGHCSCYGLENQWEPEEYTLQQMIDAFERRGKSWGLWDAHSAQIIRSLKDRQ